MKKLIYFKKDDTDYIIVIEHLDKKWHSLTVWQSLDCSNSILGYPFNIISFFNNKPYGKVGTDFDRTKLKKLLGSGYRLMESEKEREEKIKHNEEVKRLPRKRAYDLIHYRFPWLINVYHKEWDEAIHLQIEEGDNYEFMDR